MKPHPSRLQLENYPFHTDIRARFADVDPLWHLNNVRIVELYQEARIDFNMALAGEYDLLKGTDKRLLVVSQSVDYLGEIRWPGHVTIGVGVSRVGSSSFSLALGLFQNDKCAGISEAVMVYASATGSAPIPAPMRELLDRKVFKTAGALT